MNGGGSAAWYRWEGDDLLLSLRVQPRASRDGFVAPHGDSYKIRITAPPVEGKANAHLLRFLARAFGVGRRDVTLTSGGNSRNKGVRIHAPRRLPIPVEHP
ncbi:MAG TPA: YggU family protein [Sedimenticola sp.]|nr:YggU family protein [Sedimenticola sp.]